MVLIVWSVAEIICIIHLISRGELGLANIRGWLIFHFGQMNPKCWLSSAYLPWLLRYLFLVVAWQSQCEAVSSCWEERLLSWAPCDPEIVSWSQLLWDILVGNLSRRIGMLLGYQTPCHTKLKSPGVCSHIELASLNDKIGENVKIGKSFGEREKLTLSFPMFFYLGRLNKRFKI